MAKRGFEGNLMSVQSMARMKLKDSVKANKEVTIEEAKKVLEFQVKCLKDKTKEMKEFFGTLPKTVETIQITPLILTLILNDYVYEEFKLEEEDFMKHLTP